MAAGFGSYCCILNPNEFESVRCSLSMLSMDGSKKEKNILNKCHRHGVMRIVPSSYSINSPAGTLSRNRPPMFGLRILYELIIPSKF